MARKRDEHSQVGAAGIGGPTSAWCSQPKRERERESQAKEEEGEIRFLLLFSLATGNWQLATCNSQPATCNQQLARPLFAPAQSTFSPPIPAAPLPVCLRQAQFGANFRWAEIRSLGELANLSPKKAAEDSC